MRPKILLNDQVSFNYQAIHGIFFIQQILILENEFYLSLAYVADPGMGIIIIVFKNMVFGHKILEATSL